MIEISPELALWLIEILPDIDGSYSEELRSTIKDQLTKQSKFYFEAGK